MKALQEDSQNPAPELLDDRLHIERRDDMVVVRVNGAVDGHGDGCLVADLEAIARYDNSVVLDLGGATLLSKDGLTTLLAPFADHQQGRRDVCISCDRMTGRMLLEQWLADGDFVVFHSVGDAVQARIYDRSGYGRGWQPEVR